MSGVWVDASLTRDTEAAPRGVTVSVFLSHKGYLDHISGNQLLYRYPFSLRPGSREHAQVTATKAASELRIPVFIVSRVTKTRRTVAVGIVETSDDASRTFRIAIWPSDGPGAVLTAADAALDQNLDPSHHRDRLRNREKVAGRRKGAGLSALESMSSHRGVDSHKERSWLHG